jgi:CelD/BcsL family acetyltransferase involved in cellulose biosynthesis
MSWHVVPARDFAQYAARWRRLHAAGAASPLLAADFVQALLDAFGTGRELLAWRSDAGSDDARVMTIVTPGRAGAWNTFQPAQAPVGLWLQRDAGPAAPHVPALLRALPGVALMLGITECDPMLMARPADSAAVHTSDYIRTARITVAGSFDDYWDGRGKNLRSNLKKQRKRLAQDGVATHLDVLRAPEQIAAAVADYGRLETTGWKGSEGTAVAADNDQGRFYRAMLEAFAARGAASVYRYTVGGRLAAMDLCVEGGGCIVVLKTAYDESLGPQLSPALLMREEACRALFDEAREKGIGRIEFYGRVMEWHTRWTDEIRTMYHLNGYRWPVLGRLHALARRQASAAAAPAPGAPGSGS